MSEYIGLAFTHLQKQKEMTGCKTDAELAFLLLDQ